MGASGSSGTTVSATGAALEINGTSALAIPETFTINGTGLSSGGAIKLVGASSAATLSGAITVASASRINTDITSGTNTLTISGGITNTNGLTLGGIGSGTIIDNIEVVSNQDDGVEFFGGTVAVSNMYLENNDDDSIDWTEGWSGSVTNAYISHTIPGFSTVFEGDKDNANPTFTNITAISSVGGTGLQFKKESGGTITGLHLVGYDVDLDMKDNGALSNVQIDGASADAILYAGETNKYMLNSGKNAAPVELNKWSWIDDSF